MTAPDEDTTDNFTEPSPPPAPNAFDQTPADAVEATPPSEPTPSITIDDNPPFSTTSRELEGPANSTASSNAPKSTESIGPLQGPLAPENHSSTPEPDNAPQTASRDTQTPENTSAAPNPPAPAESAAANTSAAPQGQSTSAPVSTTREQVVGVQSWGDKYKAKAAYKFQHYVVNYAINAFSSAAMTYAFTQTIGREAGAQGTNDAGGFLYQKSTNAAKALADKKIFARFDSDTVNYVATQAVEYGMQSQVLLSGGHALVPVMRYLYIQNAKMEAKFGHALDWMQNKLGKGNEATKRNLEEYKQIKDAQKANNASNLSDETKERHQVKDDGSYRKNGKVDADGNYHEMTSWKPFIKARLAAMATTATLGQILSLTKRPGHELPIHYGMYEKHVGENIVGAALEHVPGFDKAFHEPRKFGKFLGTDFIYTMASMLVFKIKGESYIGDQLDKQVAAQTVARSQASKTDILGNQENVDVQGNPRNVDIAGNTRPDNSEEYSTAPSRKGFAGGLFRRSTAPQTPPASFVARSADSGTMAHAK